MLSRLLTIPMCECCEHSTAGSMVKVNGKASKDVGVAAAWERTNAGEQNSGIFLDIIELSDVQL